MSPLSRTDEGHPAIPPCFTVTGDDECLCLTGHDTGRDIWELTGYQGAEPVDA